MTRAVKTTCIVAGILTAPLGCAGEERAGQAAIDTTQAGTPGAPGSAAATVDSLDLTITVEASSCDGGVCECRGSAERSTELWRIGVEDRELDAGVRCVRADFDGNGDLDVMLSGGEGRAAAVMYQDARPTLLVPVDAGGLIEFYPARATPGPRGEPATPVPGVLVQYVGQSHLVLLWENDIFRRVLYPTS